MNNWYLKFFIFLILVCLSVYLLYSLCNGSYVITSLKVWLINFTFESVDKEKLKPHLKFKDIEFTYYGTDYKTPIINENGIVDLSKVTRIEFTGIIVNDGKKDLLLSYKNINIKSSDGQNQVNQPVLVPTENIPLKVGEEGIVTMSGLEAKSFYEALQKNDLYYLIFQPSIEYTDENNQQDKIILDEYMLCHNFYIRQELPKFKKGCSPRKMDSTN